jgi:hypothetical protein
LSGYIHHLSQGTEVAVGSLDPYYKYNPKTNESYHILKPRHPDALLFDLTHDNPSYSETRTVMDSLATASLVDNFFI